ncbi:hypothetical protein [Evansella vedderi]|nr:hypothetical protein [Evansella vedderi]
MKYFLSWLILILGIALVPLSIMMGGWISILFAGYGITMVITALLTIPIITLTLDNYKTRKSLIFKRKIKGELNRPN